MKIHYLLFITFLFIQFTSTAQEGWFEQASGVTIDLRSVCFVDDNVGLAVGDSGTALIIQEMFYISRLIREKIGVLYIVSQDIHFVDFFS